MKLVNMFDITYADIPFIEDQTIAVLRVEMVLEGKYGTIYNIHNLTEYLHKDSFSVDQGTGLEKGQSLINEIKTGFVFLVHVTRKPFSPIVNFIPNTENSSEGYWQLDLEAGFFNTISPYLRKLISSMPNNRLIQRTTGAAAGPGGYQQEGPIISAPIAKPVPLPDTRTQKWIQLEIYDDNTGLPIPGVTLNIEVPAGSKKPSGSYRSDAAGHIDVLLLAAGKCRIKSTIFNSFKNTLAYVGTGKPSTQPIDKAQTLTSGDYTIAEVEEYKVKAGDTLASIANDKNVNETIIAQFNWETTDQTKINQHLVEDVGGTSAGNEQDEVGFSNDADPGIILIPTAWKNNAVSTMTTLSLRVRQVKPAKPVVIIEHQFDLDSPEALDDLFVLETTDGHWRQVIQASSLKEISEDWVVLRFENAPKEASFNLIHDTNDEFELTQYIFENIKYADLKM